MSSLKLSTHKMSIPKMSTPKESTKIYIWLNACIFKLFHSYHFGTYGGSCMQQYNRLKGNSIKAHPEHLRAEWCLQKKVGCHWSDESWYFGSWHFGSWHFESWHFGSWHSEINSLTLCNLKLTILYHVKGKGVGSMIKWTAWSYKEAWKQDWCIVSYIIAITSFCIDAQVGRILWCSNLPFLILNDCHCELTGFSL